MVILACVCCSGDFQAKNDEARFCSQNCRSLMLRGADCAGCGKRVHKSSTSGQVQFCLECRRSNKVPVEHGTESAYQRGCRCADCKAERARVMREYYAKRKAEGRPLNKSKATVERECDECGSAYAARLDQLRAGGGRFCSIQCVGASQRGARYETRAERAERWRVSGRPGSVRWRALRRARASLELSGGNRVFVNGPCIVCGTEFMIAGQFARYCSAECRDRNSKQGFGLSWLDRMALYSRDDYNCHLCGLKVLYGGVEDYDPRMATLDHLVPQAHGGGHGFENLATAHSLCNSVRRELPVSMFRSHEAVSELRKRLFEAVRCEA